MGKLSEQGRKDRAYVLGLIGRASFLYWIMTGGLWLAGAPFLLAVIAGGLILAIMAITPGPRRRRYAAVVMPEPGIVPPCNTTDLMRAVFMDAIKYRSPVVMVGCGCIENTDGTTALCAEHQRNLDQASAYMTLAEVAGVDLPS